MSSPTRAVFFGTPAIAVPALRALAEVCDVRGVVCQPDRPAGRGLKLQAPAVKIAALELGLPVHQPTKVRTGHLDQWMRENEAEVALVMAYGRLLPLAVLEAPRLGCLNLHASILPRYRGAAPIQRAIMAGETETGISLMKMDEGMDTGAVYATRKLDISPEDTSETLAQRLSELAAEVTRHDVPRVLHGELEATPQDNARATHAAPLTRDDGRIDWGKSATDIVNQVRGLAPRPGAHAVLTREGESPRPVKILAARSTPALTPLEPGRVLIDGSRILVGAGPFPEFHVEVITAQLRGKRALPAADLINGRAFRSSDQLEPGDL